MHTILIVDDENPFLLSLKDGLTVHNDQLNILMANDGQEALNILQKNKVDLLVTDLKLPVLDGFQLLAHVSQSDPYMPVIVMTAFGTPDIEEQLSHLNALHYLEKPLDFDILAQTIESALSTESNSYIRGITLATFLQLIHMEKKSCSLTVHSRGQTGQLHMRQGELIDANTDSLYGKDAALDIIAWENTEIEMDSTCRCEKQTITAPIGFILMEAHRIKDEDNFQTMSAPTLAEETRTDTPNDNILTEDAPIIRYLHNSPAVKDFAIFNDGNFLAQLSSQPSSLEQMDPSYYLSACGSAGSVVNDSEMYYLLFTTSQNQRYMIFQWWNRRIIIALRSTGRPGQLYDELKTIISDATKLNSNGEPHATTH